MISEIVAVGIGLGAGALAMQLARAHRAAEGAAAWILVANVNTLLRLDLDHLTGDDDNRGLRELRVTLQETAAKRSASERRLFERFNALVGVAIAFGERVHDVDGTVDLRAVANRRAHLQNALALGDRLEAALGGITELALDPESVGRIKASVPRKNNVAMLATARLKNLAAATPALDTVPAVVAGALSAPVASGAG